MSRQSPEISQAGQGDGKRRSASLEVPPDSRSSAGTRAMASLARTQARLALNRRRAERSDAGEEEHVREMTLADAHATGSTPRWLWPTVAVVALSAGALVVAVEIGKAFMQTGNAQRVAPAASVAQGGIRSRQASSPGGETGGTAASEEIATGSAVGREEKGPPERSPVVEAAPAIAIAVQHRSVAKTSSAPTAEQPIPRPLDEGFVSLFNGRDLTGWLPVPTRSTAWSFVDVMIVGQGPGRGYLYTENGDHANFHARIEAKVTGAGNAGFCFRVPAIGDGEFGAGGYEVIIDTNGKTGRIIDYGNEAEYKAALTPPNEWFRLDVIALGRKILVDVNGIATLNSYDLTGKSFRGHFALTN